MIKIINFKRGIQLGQFQYHTETDYRISEYDLKENAQTIFHWLFSFEFFERTQGQSSVGGGYLFISGHPDLK